jgi:hypothetical protein
VLDIKEIWQAFENQITKNVHLLPYWGSWTPFINSMFFEMSKIFGYYCRFERIGRIDLLWITKNNEIQLALEYEDNPKSVDDVIDEIRKLNDLTNSKLKSPLKIVVFFVGYVRDDAINKNRDNWCNNIASVIKSTNDHDKWFFIPFALLTENGNNQRVKFELFSVDNDGNSKCVAHFECKQQKTPID